jgi:uncharacterized protein YecE (DUF72 family)
MTVYVGTSGWQYRDWRGKLYPQQLVQRDWLAHYAERFATVEVNNTFYRLPPPERFEAWEAGTPDDFVFTIKASRYLTHIKRLKEPAGPVERLMSHAAPLRRKLGPVLVQLPPTMKVDLDRLAATLDAFPDGVRVTVEPRHDTWLVDELHALLAERGAALCLADRDSKPILPLWRTADWGFVRFHAGTGTPWPCYGRTALDSWARRLADRWGPDDDVYAYFNNDPNGCAVRDARRFSRALQRVGLHPTRTPHDRETPVFTAEGTDA